MQKYAGFKHNKNKFTFVLSADKFNRIKYTNYNNYNTMYN